MAEMKFDESNMRQAIERVNAAYARMNDYVDRFVAGEKLDEKTVVPFLWKVHEEIVPMAEQLGMHAVQLYLQDSLVRLAYPDEYVKLHNLLRDSEAMCANVFKAFSMPIKAMLDDLGIEYEFSCRMKSVYSIWRKMKVDNKEFDDVYDLFATRLVYKVPKNVKPKPLQDSIPTMDDMRREMVEKFGGKAETPDDYDLEKLYCWRIFNVVMMLYRVNPDRIKDWVTHPKPSGYQALQLTVMGPDCNWIELQIRSERMNYDAEEGAAAHWRYKDETMDKLKAALQKEAAEHGKKKN